ncbi:MAG TPA: sugar transferase, partial [Ferruginibacter sp.]|nr:sugar transferase [Ferruginibacter sp.]
MDTETNAMSQEIKPAGISSAANLTIVPVEEDSAFASLHLAGQNPATVIDLRHFILQQQAHPLGNRYKRLLKRAIDITVSAFVITFLLSWITALIAILIKLDSRGPVFFLQKRNKRRGELFSCIKFRSMVCNADADTLPAGKNDQRITRFGAFLRRYHLDELPQFFNVLLGDMSVIGPRPHMV